jgi:hypothetical protein
MRRLVCVLAFVLGCVPNDDRHDLPVQPSGVVFIGSIGSLLDAGVSDSGVDDALNDAGTDAPTGDARAASDARVDAAILDAPTVALDAF